jgi:hypothetical protein
MRYFFIAILLFITFYCYSQPKEKIILSAIVADPDSIPIPNVAITDVQSGKTLRTNSKGFFQAEITADDSLFIYHIAYKRRFINEKDNGKLIILEPEVHELKQFDVTDKGAQNQKNLDETVKDIKRLAPLKKITEYDMKARQNRFIKENGSHDKGFSPYFGPTIKSPLAKVVALVAGNEEKRQRKKLTSHYHLIKKKK